MAGRLQAIGAFAYDFVVGDDWLLAVGVVAGLAVTYALSQESVTAWWLLPLLLAVLLPVSLRRAVRGRRAGTGTVASTAAVTSGLGGTGPGGTGQAGAGQADPS